MNVGEFMSTNGVRPVRIDPNAQKYDELVALMIQAHTIQEWNELRKQAKSIFKNELISRLDASGLVSKLNLRNDERL